MKLTDDQMKTVLTYINEKWPDKPCPICQHKKWTISDKVFEVREFEKGILVIGGSIIPMIILFCNDCGYMVSFNAILMGIVPPDVQRNSEIVIKDKEG